MSQFTTRGRGGQRGRGSNQHRGRGLPYRTPDPELHPEGSLIKTVKITDIEAKGKNSAETKTLKVANAKYVASYNWSGGKSGAILVPGAPPRWSPPVHPPMLQQDSPSGVYYRDINAARWPTFPIEPAIQAIYHSDASFDASKVDVVGCGSTLGNLLRFASSIGSTFHFKAEKIGETLFLVRQERSPTERIEGIRGYGHTFPEAYTTWDKDTKGSESHQRLLKYEFGGLEILLRSETDGYLKEKLGTESSVAEKGTNPGTSNNFEEESVDVATALSSIAIAGQASEVANPKASLSVETTSTSISQASIFDLKTRSSWTPFSMSEILPRLWLNRTPNFILAQHTRGVFTNESIQVTDVRREVEEWESSHASELRLFRGVIKKLTEVVDGLAEGERKVGVWRIGNGDLQIRALTSSNRQWSALPKALQARWTATEIGEGEQADEELRVAEESNDEDEDFLKF